MIWNNSSPRLLFLLSVVTTLYFLSVTTATVVEGGERSTTSSSHEEEPRQESRRQNRTNVVILLADNLAYDDVGVFQGAHDTNGNRKRRSRTPNLDNAAREGRRLLNWNSPAVLCSASRAALLTGEFCERSARHNGIANA